MSLLVGIGVDIAHIPRFLRVYNKFGDRFLNRAFHPEEIAEFQKLPDHHQPAFLASRWAVKEAAVKASRNRLLFPDIRLLRTKQSVSPELYFSGSSQDMLNEAGITRSLVSLSHDGDYTVAYVNMFSESAVR